MRAALFPSAPALAAASGRPRRAAPVHAGSPWSLGLARAIAKFSDRGGRTRTCDTRIMISRPRPRSVSPALVGRGLELDADLRAVHAYVDHTKTVVAGSRRARV